MKEGGRVGERLREEAGAPGARIPLCLLLGLDATLKLLQGTLSTRCCGPGMAGGAAPRAQG